MFDEYQATIFLLRYIIIRQVIVNEIFFILCNYKSIPTSFSNRVRDRYIVFPYGCYCKVGICIICEKFVTCVKTLLGFYFVITRSGLTTTNYPRRRYRYLQVILVHYFPTKVFSILFI